MDRALSCQMVANKIWAAEKSIDTAMADAAALMAGISQAREELGLSAIVASGATNKVAEAIATLATARAAVVEAHKELDETKLRIGVRTKLIGVTDKPPEGVERGTGEIRRVG